MKRSNYDESIGRLKVLSGPEQRQQTVRLAIIISHSLLSKVYIKAKDHEEDKIRFVCVVCEHPHIQLPILHIMHVQFAPNNNDNSACSFCGVQGHIAWNCPKRHLPR